MRTPCSWAMQPSSREQRLQMRTSLASSRTLVRLRSCLRKNWNRSVKATMIATDESMLTYHSWEGDGR